MFQTLPHCSVPLITLTATCCLILQYNAGLFVSSRPLVSFRRPFSILFNRLILLLMHNLTFYMPYWILLIPFIIFIQPSILSPRSLGRFGTLFILCVRSTELTNKPVLDCRQNVLNFFTRFLSVNILNNLSLFHVIIITVFFPPGLCLIIQT